MSPWLFAGLAVLTALVLAALQFLRVRPRRVRVATHLFWQKAADQTRPRTLFQRFRHPLTYLLLLAICLLVLLALARPMPGSAERPYRVVVLEAGLTMTAADGRFEKALEQVRAEASAIDEGHLAVIAADPQPRVIKHFDESLTILQQRLGQLRAADIPVIRENLFASAKSLLAGRGEGEVVIVSSQTMTPPADGVRIVPVGGIINNAFLLSTVFLTDPADPTRGDFHARAGFTGKEAAPFTFKVTRGDEVLVEESASMEPGAVKEFTVPALAANGQKLAVSLEGADLIAADNRVVFSLPDRRRIQVLAMPGTELPAALGAVLAKLPETTRETTATDLPIVRVGPPGSDAEIVIHPAPPTGEMLPVRTANHPLVDALSFEDSACRAPSSTSVSGLPLLLANGNPLAWLDGGRLHVSSSLFDDDASIVRRTAYLVFWSNVFHQLAGWSDEPPTLSPEQGARSSDPTALVMKAGNVNFDIAPEAASAISLGSVSLGLTLWQWLLLAALSLMTCEAILNLRRKIS